MASNSSSSLMQDALLGGRLIGPQVDSILWTLYLPSFAALWSCVLLLNDVSRGHYQATTPSPGSRITAWTRAAGSVLLLALSAFIVAADDDKIKSTTNVALFLFYLYLSAVCLSACVASCGLTVALQRHATALMLVSFGVYTIRDLWPLATFTLQPCDSAWVQIMILFICGVVLPLITPVVYRPVDPSKYGRTPSPEQTASPLSFMLYTFVDQLVVSGYRSDHLSLDMLPPVADYDRAQRTRDVAYPLLECWDGKHNIGWTFLQLFWTDFAKLGIGLVIRVVTSFGSPIALNRLLLYVESAGAGAVVRPWWYFFTASRLAVRVEALVTQLVFSHAVRMRRGFESKVNEKENVVGTIQNLVTTDLANIVAAKDSLLLFINVPLQVIAATYFLYALLGWSSLVGLFVMIACFPLPGWVAAKLYFITAEQMKRTDARVDGVSKILRVLRMIKLFAWESKMKEKLNSAREDELIWIRSAKFTGLVNKNLNYLIPLLTMIATYTTFTLMMNRELSASIVFSSMALFSMLQTQLETAGFCLPLMVQVKVSLDRLTEFLTETPLLDRFAPACEKPCGDAPSDVVASSSVAFHNATFTYSTTPSSSSFQLRVPGPAPLVFTNGALNLIVGPTGAGKSSVLLALLGEMHMVSPFSDLHFTGEKSWYHLPRENGVAYAPQEGWVLSGTVKDNILFGLPFDETRFNQVIMECALERDIVEWENGILTEVGEQGVTLSGGQRARITLARVVYSTADVVLLDDVLSALDVNTLRWVVDHCISGQLLRGRTVLLVTHHVSSVVHLARSIIAVHNGVVQQHESLPRELKMNIGSGTEAQTIAVATESDKSNTVEKDMNPHSKLLAPETAELGTVQWPALHMYFSSLGGIVFWIVFLTSLFSSEILKIIQTYFLGYWASLYDTRKSSEVPVPALLTEYAGLLLLGLVVYSVAFAVFVLASMKASRTIHNKLISSIFGATMRWLDSTPSSRIIMRCTQDLRAVDGPLSDLFAMLAELTISLVCKFATVVLMSPLFVVPGLVVFGVGWACGRIYMKAQMPVKREMSIAKAPILTHFTVAAAGLVSLRAYGAESRFEATLSSLLDNYTRAARSFDNLSRWVCIRVHAMGGLFAAGLATFLVYGSHNLSAGSIGFSLTIAISFSGMTLAWVMITNMFEVEGNSLERILGYTQIEQEPPASADGIPPAAWPTSGSLRIDRLSAKYFKGGPLVLRDINLDVASGQRIGIVGRTGSGKTSLTLALLRCLLTSGQVTYDGVDTRKINLHALRSNVTVIPQQPELLEGSLRYNLDPFEQHDDAELNAALQHAGLRGKFTLDSHISSSGDNLSLGQRQMVALARALVRRSKVVILDEATAAIDYDADANIQAALKTELANSTVFTVAHRLRTVMDYDKVVVLDGGRVVEFDAPAKLLRNESGFLRSLVNESRDKEELIRLANNLNGRDGGVS